MIEVRLYFYDETQDNGLGEELNNVMIGSKYVLPLDDTNDTAEISINNSTRKEPYPQLTKFVVMFKDNESTHYKHYELRYDLVEKLGMANELYKHSLFLGNPAISCQKRSVDNFAISYKLKDVSIDSDTFNENMLSYAYNGDLFYGGYHSTTPLLTSQLILGFFESAEIKPYKETILNPTIDVISYKYSQQHYFSWESNNWYLAESNDKVSVIPTAVSNQYLTLMGETKRAFILDKSVDGLSQASIQKLEQCAQDQDTTIQVCKVQGKTYAQHIEQPPIVDSNGWVRYVVPQLYSYNSNATTSSHSIDTSTQKVFIPTKTTITITNHVTGNTTSRSYITKYGHPSEYLYGENYCYNDTSFAVKTGVEDIVQLGETSTRRVYYKDSLFRTYTSNVDGVGFIDENCYFNVGGANSQVIGDGYSKKGYYGNIGFAINNEATGLPTLEQRLVRNNNVIKFQVEENCTYTIKTEAYFGTNSERILEIPIEDKTQYLDLVNASLFNTEVGDNQCLVDVYYSSAVNINDKRENIFEKKVVNGSDIYVSFEFTVLAPDNLVNYIIKPSSKPTTYDLFVKAQVCNYPKKVTEGFYSQLTENLLPYVVDDSTKARMKAVNLIEDVYQDKNLWEIFMQIGKYIHAKPYIKFYQDKYQLCFRNYGISEESHKNTTHNSIYSSNDIESYISSLDSYVANMLQRGNEVTEVLVPKENDGSHICVTDNAVLKTKYPMLEVVYLGVRHKNNPYNDFTDITEYIFEHNIYKLLPIIKDTSISSYSHYAGNSIYYHLNQKQIMGLQYRSPDATNVKPYAIKQLLYDVGFGQYYSNDVSNICVNDFTFLIRYRTSDDVRVKTFKPDLRKFMCNAGTDDFPIQTQYSNQNDKTIDSKKLGENLYGQLLRSGNTSKDRFEYVTKLNDIKEAGELYRFDDNNYYVAKNTLIFYPAQVQCEVEYSKDYNKLSEIIGIDSQPRFYEIAETGAIKRDIVFDAFLTLGTGATKQGDYYDYKYRSFKSGLEYSMCQNKYDKVYACTFLKGANKDKDTESNDFQVQVVSPTLIFNNAHTLTIEWDMEDNFSAGSYYTSVSDDVSKVLTNSSWLYPVLNFINTSVIQNLSDSNYTEANQVQYCDVFGKADLVDFALFQPSYPFTQLESRLLPKLNKSEGDSNDQECYNFVSTSATAFQTQQDYTNLCKNDRGFYIDKDNRETLGFNLNIHMLTDSDRFIISSLFWEKKLTNDNQIYTDYKLVFLGKEVNKFSKDTIIENEILAQDTITLDQYQATFGDMLDGANNYVFGTILPYKHISQERWDEIKDKVESIAIVFEIETSLTDITKSNMKYIWARNVGGLETTYLDNANDNSNEKLSAISYIPTWKKD